VKYLLDANVFIEAKNRHYAFDFCPAFWDWLDGAHAAGVVGSIDKIGAELRAGDDELAEWATARASFFAAADAAVIASLRQTTAWATQAGFTTAAAATYAQAGDSQLVAHGHAHGLTIITHEVAAPTLKKVKIPNACQALGVSCMSPYEMLRIEGASFVLSRGTY